MAAAALTGPETDVRTALREEGCPDAARSFRVEADLRYVGQACELTVPMSPAPGDTLAGAAAAFHAQHRRTHGHASDNDAVELVNLCLICRRIDSGDRAFRPGALDGPADPLGTRNVCFRDIGGRVEIPILPREPLLSGPRRGPLIVEEYDSTPSVRPAGWRNWTHLPTSS